MSPAAYIVQIPAFTIVETIFVLELHFLMKEFNELFSDKIPYNKEHSTPAKISFLFSLLCLHTPCLILFW